MMFYLALAFLVVIPEGNLLFTSGLPPLLAAPQFPYIKMKFNP
jgi:hypothetical protein